MSRPDPATGVLARPYRALTFGAVSLVSLVAFEYLAVATAMPTVAQALDGLPLYALAFAGALAAGIVGMVLAGVWSDARGPAAPLWTGVATFTAGLLVVGLARDMPVLVLGRVVQGFGGGIITVALYVVVGRVYPQRLRPRIFAVFAASWVVPSIVGPPAAGLIVEHLGWRWVFLGVPVLALPAALLVRPGLRLLADRPDPDRPPDAAPARRGRILPWALGAAVSAGLLHHGGQLRGPAAAVTVALALAGIAVFAPRLLPAGTLHAARGLPAVIALRGVAAAAFFAAEVFLPLTMSRERGLSPATAGLVLTVGAVAWAGGSWYQGRPGLAVSRTRLLQLGMVLMAVGIGTASLAAARAVPVVVAMAGWGIAGSGIGLVFPTLSVLTLDLSPPAEQGANSSALQLSDSLFTAVVLALTGSLFAALITRSGPAAYLVGFAVAAALAVLGLGMAGRTRPTNASDTDETRVTASLSPGAETQHRGL